MKLHYSLPLLVLVSCKTTRVEDSGLRSELIEKKSLGLSLNDASILFPNHQNPAFLEKMPTLAEGFVPEWAGQELANNFENKPTGDTTAPGPGRFQADLSPYKLAAMRIDPCPNDLQTQGEDKLCIRQLRATWQIQNRELGPFAMDSNVHTAYYLSDEQFRAILTRLRAMHAAASLDTTEMPLGVQPVIQKEGPESPYLQGALEILKTYAKPTNLMVIAGLRRADFETWTMTTFSQDLKTQKIQQNNLIAVQKAGDDSLQKLQIFAPNRQSSSSFMIARPASSIEKSITEDKKENFSHALAFENPRLHNPLTADCSSCHQAVHLSANPNYAQDNADPEIETNRFTSVRNLTVTIPDAGDRTALQMFSFSQGRPRVTPRVVNETVNVLDYLEKNGF